MLGVLFVLNQPNTTMCILLRETISLEIPFQEHKHKQILQFDLVSSLQNVHYLSFSQHGLLTL